MSVARYVWESDLFGVRNAYNRKDELGASLIEMSLLQTENQIFFLKISFLHFFKFPNAILSRRALLI